MGKVPTEMRGFHLFQATVDIVNKLTRPKAAVRGK